MKKYLPSKKFVIITLSIFATLGLVFFLVGKFQKNPDGSLAVKDNWSLSEEKIEAQTLGELVKKDSDQDGLPDWEETLWGLDPRNPETTPGTKDADVVAKRRAELEPMTENGTKEIKIPFFMFSLYQ